MKQDRETGGWEKDVGFIDMEQKHKNKSKV